MFKKISKVICIALFSQACALMAFAQNETVKGHVVDDKGDPVAGASVVIKGTAGGTATDANGNFTISASKGSTLTITAINYVTNDVKVTSADFTITLASNGNKKLDEVVVVGYGTQRREAITGSVATIGGDRLREVPSPNISQALQGRLAGVDVSQTSTKPGASWQIL